MGSRPTEQYLVPTCPALDRLHASHGVRLTVISAGVPNPAMRERDWIRFVAWRPDTYAAELAGCDIALAPLSDTAFARGKCAYKLLQYAASALPMVGSPVGANRLALDRFEGSPWSSPATGTTPCAALLDSAAAGRASRATTGLAAVRRWYAFAAWSEQLAQGDRHPPRLSLPRGTPAFNVWCRVWCTRLSGMA